MNNKFFERLTISDENYIKVLLEEYAAIERMHAHYDVINMSLLAIITAGVFAFWGIIIQTRFQSDFIDKEYLFANSVGVLSYLLLIILSVWVRYMTIHRCIVYKKLDRSQDIEDKLGMMQNKLFKYDRKKLSAPIDSDQIKRRPGGHTLELLLYFSLSTFGGVISLIFLWEIKDGFTFGNALLFVSLFFAPILSTFWMGFCKLDAMQTMRNKVEVGLPWSVLFPTIILVNKFLRGIFSKTYIKV